MFLNIITMIEDYEEADDLFEGGSRVDFTENTRFNEYFTRKRQHGSILQFNGQTCKIL